MNDLDRLFRQLVLVLAEEQPEHLTSAFQLSELYQSMVPYRRYRKQLGFESNEDYEMAVLRLVSGESEYATVEPAEVREQLLIEAQATNPNPGAFREFAAARVKLNEKAVRSVQSASRTFAPPVQTDEASSQPEQWTQFAPPAEAKPEDSPRPPVFEAADRDAVQIAPECPNCTKPLPAHRKAQYCPFCGCPLTAVPCPICGDEIEVGWRFCITCGRDGSVA